MKDRESRIAKISRNTPEFQKSVNILEPLRKHANMKGGSKYLIVLLLATSCVGQGIIINDKSPHNSQATELRKKEEVKPDLSGRQPKDYVTGEILVKFKDGTDMQTIEMIKNKLHLKDIRVVSSPDLYLMKIPDGSSVEQVMESLSKYEEVKYSEPNYVRTSQ